MGLRTWDPKGQGLEQASLLNVYIQIYCQAGKLQTKSRSQSFL